MKKLLILVVLLLLAGGGGWFFFLKDNGAVKEVNEHEEILKGEHVYIRLKPFTVTVFRDNLPAGTFSASLTLEIAGENVRGEYTKRESRMRDVMFREIHAMVERELVTGREIDLDQVKQRMLAVSLALLGSEVVVDIYVNAVLRNGT